jgi:hypothetical protein
MKQTGHRFLFVAALAASCLTLCWPIGASAQTGKNFDVKTMNFDLWCQEQANLPADRCDKRLPEDEKTFEAYRTKIERYEIPYLQQQRNEANFDRNVLHNDPIDRPLSNNAPAQSQDPNQPPANAPP